METPRTAARPEAAGGRRRRARPRRASAPRADAGAATAASATERRHRRRAARRSRSRRRWSPTWCPTRPPRRPRPRASQGSWPEEESGERSSAPRVHAGLAAGRTPPGARRCALAARRAAGHAQRRRQVRLRRRPSARPTARATSASSRRCGCSAISRWPARPACCTSSSRDTEKEIFLVGGAPESVSSSNPNERFGEYLVGKQVLGRARSRARAQHAAALQRQAGRHAGGAGPAAPAGRLPAAVGAGARSRDRRVRLDRGDVRLLPRRHQPPGELPARPRHVRDPRRRRGQPAYDAARAAVRPAARLPPGRDRPRPRSSRRRSASAPRRARCSTCSTASARCATG